MPALYIPFRGATLKEKQSYVRNCCLQVYTAPGGELALSTLVSHASTFTDGATGKQFHVVWLPAARPGMTYDIVRWIDEHGKPQMIDSGRAWLDYRDDNG